jgi:hypothetical protein
MLQHALWLLVPSARGAQVHFNLLKQAREFLALNIIEGVVDDVIEALEAQLDVLDLGSGGVGDRKLHAATIGTLGTTQQTIGLELVDGTAHSRRVDEQALSKMRLRPALTRGDDLQQLELVVGAVGGVGDVAAQQQSAGTTNINHELAQGHAGCSIVFDNHCQHL